MDRRELLKRLSLLVGGTLVAPSLLTASGTGDVLFSDELDFSGLAFFSKTQRKLLGELAEIIIPRTAGVPGAKDAKVVPFIELILQDCRDEAAKKAFLDGLAKFEADTKANFGKGFLKLKDQNRIEAVENLQKVSKADRKKRELTKSKEGELFWYQMKSLTTWAFFTSEAGATQAMNWMLVPGPYQGSRKMVAGERTFM